jgi:hypothetical protein
MNARHIATIISGPIITPVFFAPRKPLPAANDQKAWSEHYAAEQHWVNFYSAVKQHFAGMGQDDGENK